MPGLRSVFLLVMLFTALSALANEDNRPRVICSVDNPSLKVRLLTPSTGTVYPRAPAAITLTASAVDGEGEISKVDFYHGNTLLGTVTAKPYRSAVVNGNCNGTNGWTFQQWQCRVCK